MTAVRRQFGWNLLGQLASATSNFLCTITAARALSPSSFGGFALLMTAYILALGVSRSLVGERLMIMRRRSSAADHAGPLSASVLLALLAAACVLAVAAAGGQSALAVWIFALFLPALVLQDALRYLAFADGRPMHAAVSDGAWLLLEAPVLCVLLLRPERASLAIVVLTWAAAGALAAAVGIRLMPASALVVRPRDGTRWLGRELVHTRQYLLEYGVGAGASQAMIFVAAAAGGPAAAGAIRGAQSILGPLAVVLAAASSTISPRLRDLPASRDGLGRACFSSGLMTMAVLSAVGLIAVALAHLIGEELLGATWEEASRCLPFVAATLALSGMSLFLGVGCRIIGVTRRASLARLLLLPCQVTAVAVATAKMGALGAATVITATALLVTFLYGTLLWRSLPNVYASHHEGPDATY